jgi:hypothetical protein
MESPSPRSPSDAPPAAPSLGAPRRVVAWLFAGLAGAATAAVLGGLLRTGGEDGGRVLSGPGALLLGRVLGAHATLALGGFLGTWIGLRRALAFRHPVALAGPAASALGAIAIVAGAAPVGHLLLVVAGLALAGVEIGLACRVRHVASWIRVGAAITWVVGEARLLGVLSAPSDGFAVPGEVAVLAAYAGLAFLALSTAADRLDPVIATAADVPPPAERHPAVDGVFGVAAVAVALASLVVAAWPVAALYVLGIGLASIGACGRAVDVPFPDEATPGAARGVPPGTAALAADAWLVVAGAAWIAAAAGAGAAARDVGWHAVGIGVAASMAIAATPRWLRAAVGVPFAADVALRWAWWGLHAALVVHVAGAWLGAGWRVAGDVGLAVALAGFLELVLAAFVVSRRGRSSVP